jgi:hypothetical protein
MAAKRRRRQLALWNFATVACGARPGDNEQKDMEGTKLDRRRFSIQRLFARSAALSDRGAGRTSLGDFKRLCVETETDGPRVSDAWYAALAIEWGCEWITLDRLCALSRLTLASARAVIEKSPEDEAP